MTIKVALIHNIISPYRVPLFEELFSRPEIDFTVYYCSRTQKQRKWDIIDSTKYRYVVLPGITIEMGVYTCYFNPSIITEIILGKYDVVILYGYMDFTTQIAFILSKLMRIPIILWTEGISSAETGLGRIASPVTDFIVKSVDAIVVPGTLSKDYFISKGALESNVFVAPNSVRNAFYISESQNYLSNRNKVQEELGLKDRKIVIYVGQIIERKGIPYLIDAFQKVSHDFPEAVLLIVGDGDQKCEIEKLCKDKKLQNVIFTSWLSDIEKIRYLSIADVFVLPTNEDVWGLVVNEAMCCRLPVIATDAAGCSKDMIIPGQNGYIVEAKNPDQLYNAIKKVFSNKEVSYAMGRKSLEIIESDFSVEKMAQGFINAINSVLRLNNKKGA